MEDILNYSPTVMFQSFVSRTILQTEPYGRRKGGANWSVLGGWPYRLYFKSRNEIWKIFIDWTPSPHIYLNSIFIQFTRLKWMQKILKNKFIDPFQLICSAGKLVDSAFLGLLYCLIYFLSGWLNLFGCFFLACLVFFWHGFVLWWFYLVWFCLVLVWFSVVLSWVGLI